MDTTQNRNAFEHVRTQIGSCGLWCGSCAVGNGCLTELAADLQQLITDYGLPEWAAVEAGWERFLDSLSSVKQTACCAGCRQGGGRDNCEMRACALGRGVRHCTDCASFGSCDEGVLLDRMRSGAAAVGMSLLMPAEDPDTMLPQWTRELRSRRPSCLLFAEGA